VLPGWSARESGRHHRTHTLLLKARVSYTNGALRTGLRLRTSAVLAAAELLRCSFAAVTSSSRTELRVLRRQFADLSAQPSM